MQPQSWRNMNLSWYRFLFLWMFHFSVKIHDLSELKDIYAIITVEDAGGKPTELFVIIRWYCCHLIVVRTGSAQLVECMTPEVVQCWCEVCDWTSSLGLSVTGEVLLVVPRKLGSVQMLAVYWLEFFLSLWSHLLHNFEEVEPEFSSCLCHCLLSSLGFPFIFLVFFHKNESLFWAVFHDSGNRWHSHWTLA